MKDKIKVKEKDVCPAIGECNVPQEKKDFLSDCVKNWKECFIQNSRLPREWFRMLKITIEE